ncbi:stage V sporulation protein T [Jeotgalibacillus proteolyticus]|uniref:Stage V sporulation protein T n=1 Tax=Jeotgalibacillus proteolyticus TaxID=2082395 RepID=A0A2S5G6J1_9BACL|nr:stage V sporulation protein T [Jeotgalibacillus proteolyticus]PPA68541.1 stage V sporulation protein T [Jeotgalibacillus proteolyticus]
MKATGIVRRIDDLGRVVIPKEIRRTLRIREGDPLEIFVDREGEVILKKYSPINELGSFAKEYAEALQDSLGHPVLICDRDNVIAIAGVSKKEYLNRRIGSGVEEIMAARKSILSEKQTSLAVIEHQDDEAASYAISPIVSSGDPIGAVIIFSKDQALSEVEMKSCETAASFLGRQMEH